MENSLSKTALDWRFPSHLCIWRALCVHSLEGPGTDSLQTTGQPLSAFLSAQKRCILHSAHGNRST